MKNQSWEKVLFGLFFLSFALNNPLKSQWNCGSTGPLQVENAPNNLINVNRSGPYIIPVIFHVYWNEQISPVAPGHIRNVLDETNDYLRAEDPGIENVPEQFLSLIEDAQIELRLASRLPDGSCTSGILYHYYNLNSGQPNDINYSVETSNYLNIHVYPAVQSYATYPNASTFLNDPGDRIVFSYWDINNRFSALAHELGHWLNLIHTFGNVGVTGGECGEDFVDDTPPTRGSTDCNLALSDCTPGILENVNNYMDYSSCGCMFTSGQVARMHAALEDTTLNRNQIFQESNLIYTGVSNPEICSGDFQFWDIEYPDCDSTRVRYSYYGEGQIPDSVKWEFFQPEYTVSFDEMPTHYYTSGGAATVYFTAYYNGVAETINFSHAVNLNQINTNLSLIEDLPLNLDADAGLELPNEHMNLLSALPEEGWQICNFTGYSSNKCLYVPARVVDGEAFADLEMGMFDMSGLAVPEVSFKIAAAMVPQGAFRTIQILFRDECSSAFVGNIWFSKPLNEFFNGNVNSGFVPDSDDQWVDIHATFPAWVQSHHGFITLRLKTNMPSTFSGEPLYIDDFRIGEQELITSNFMVSGKQELCIYPNPGNGIINWKTEGYHKGNYLIKDLQGRTLKSGSNKTLLIAQK
ncbi:MAG: M43 family zinc metalloprotease [Bacteroidia bacterium]